MRFAVWLDSHQASTDLHESYYMYNWIEATHVLTLMVFLGMLCVIDLRMLGLAFTRVPASTIARRLDKPMLLGFTVMVMSGLLLFYAIPVRTTTSIWFRIKVVLIIAAGINALLFRNAMTKSVGHWDADPIPPKRYRVGAGLSLTLWIGVIATGRMIAYDWFDCHKEMPNVMYWAAGCVNELAALSES
ncbi:MAG: DUF6644 family protein [Pseudomonadota bacterium]